MSRAMKPRSVAIELPHSGALRASLTCWRMKSSTWASASATVSVDASTALSSPDSLCMFDDDLVHLQQCLLGRGEHQVDPVAELVQLPVGHQAGHFEQPVAGQVKPRHLTVDPNEAVIHVAKVTRGREPVPPGARVRWLPVWRTAHTQLPADDGEAAQ